MQKSMNWIDLVQDRDKRRDTVNVVMNFRILKMPEYSWQTEERLAFLDGLWYTASVISL
jgi:hypothetical protein